MGKLALLARHHLAGKIDKGGLKPKRRYVDADGIATFGIDAEVGGGIAAAFGSIADACNIVLLFQFADNVGYGLNRKPHAPGDIGPRDWPMLAYGLKHNPPIVRPPKLLVRSP